VWDLGVGIVCASTQLFFYVPIALSMQFAAAGGENASPEDIADARWLLYAAPALLGLSVATIVAVARRRRFWVAAGEAGQLALGVPILVFALDGSVHSDPSLLAIAAVIWALGLATVIETFKEGPV
jgi:hypothetical protein